MDPGANHDAAFAHRAQRGRHERADRSEDERGVERRRGHLVGASRPPAAEGEREALSLLVARTGEREDLAPLMHRHLGEQVSCGAEAVETEPQPAAGETERAVADQARAEQRCRGLVGKVLGNREAELRSGGHFLGVSAVTGVAGEDRRVAQILLAAPAELTDPARSAQPGNPDPLAERELAHSCAELFDRADDLMSGHERQLGLGELAVDDVQVGPADCARPHREPDLARRRLRLGELREPQRLAHPLEDHRAHRQAIAAEEISGWAFRKATRMWR